MKLQMLSFRGDNILDRRIKEASNYCDNSHIYAATFGVCRIVLAELLLSRKKLGKMDQEC